MRTSVRVLGTSLIWTGICACSQAGKPADTAASTTDTAVATVSESVGTTTQSPGSVASPTTVQTPVKSAPVKKVAMAPAALPGPAPIMTARADSIRLAQARAEAVRVADSIRLAEAARAARAVATQPTVPKESPTTVDVASQGKAPYDANCRKCHGVAGVPPKAMQTKFPKLKPFDAAYFAKRSSDSVVAVLMNGVGDGMKSFKDKMSHEEMVATAAYIRTFAKP